MSQARMADLYHQFYAAIDFERRAVFEAIRAWAGGCETVLYPGSFMHITPSFVFQHVVYVDQKPEAVQFFADEAGIKAFVCARKQYKQQPYMRFVAHDYTTALPLRKNAFDLLLAIYAGGIAEACLPYLKVGGLLLSNNHHDDAGFAARSRDYELVAVMAHKGDKCQISEAELDRYFVPKTPRGKRAPAQFMSTQPEYTQNADYYIFRKVAVS